MLEKQSGEFEEYVESIHGVFFPLASEKWIDSDSSIILSSNSKSLQFDPMLER